ncbi:DUF4870 domain-containing protein [Cellulomonas sp. NPDC055163]|jgi:uncharacterized Tic20 family protein
MSDHPPAGHTAAPLTDAETRQWAGLAHLGGILWIIPGLIIWLVFRARSAFVDQEGKKAVNFQITLLLASIVLSVVRSVLPFDALWNLAQFALWVVSIIFSIQGYLAVQRGQAYRYPFSLELIK